MGSNGRLKKNMKATTVNDRGAVRVVTVYSTEIIRVTADKIVLDNGGWITRMTTDRMNQASGEWDLGLKVYRRGGRMFAQYRGEVYEFDNHRLELPR